MSGTSLGQNSAVGGLVGQVGAIGRLTTEIRRQRPGQPEPVGTDLPAAMLESVDMTVCLALAPLAAGLLAGLFIVHLIFG